jgi:hypothetical protein
MSGRTEITGAVLIDVRTAYFEDLSPFWTWPVSKAVIIIQDRFLIEEAKDGGRTVYLQKVWVRV